MSMNPPKRPPTRRERIEKAVAEHQNLIYLVIGYLMAIGVIALTRGW